MERVLDQKSVRDFIKALELYERATKKDMADVVNRAGFNVAMRAMSFTPKSRLGRIQSWRPAARGSSRVPRRRKLFHALAKGRQFKNRGGRRIEVTGARHPNVASKAAELHSRRLASSGYIRAGWLNAGHDLAKAAGRRPPRNKPSRKGDAALGGGSKATPLQLVSEITNYATGAGEVGFEALEDAVKFVALDMVSYAEKKMGLTARKYSAREIRRQIGR